MICTLTLLGESKLSYEKIIVGIAGLIRAAIPTIVRKYRTLILRINRQWLVPKNDNLTKLKLALTQVEFFYILSNSKILRSFS